MTSRRPARRERLTLEEGGRICPACGAGMPTEAPGRYCGPAGARCHRAKHRHLAEPVAVRDGVPRFGGAVGYGPAGPPDGVQAPTEPSSRAARQCERDGCDQLLPAGARVDRRHCGAACKRAAGRRTPTKPAKTLQRTCTECGRSYAARRSTSRVCSDRCRQRAHRGESVTLTAPDSRSESVPLSTPTGSCPYPVSGPSWRDAEVVDEPQQLILAAAGVA